MPVGQPTVRPVKTPPSAPQRNAVNSNPNQRWVPDAQGRPILPGDLPPLPRVPSPKPEAVPAQTPEAQRPRDVEVETIRELPSQFKGYNGIDYIEICAFTLGELKYLASDLTDLQVIEAFKNKIRNISVLELSVYDFWFIGSFINVMTSKISEWIMTVTCGACGEGFTHQTSRDGMFVFDVLDVPDLPVVVTLNGKEFKFDIPRVKDMYTARELKKQFPNASEELITLACQARISMLPYEALVILENLTDLEDIELVNEVQKLFYHGAAPLAAKCPKCGYEGKYGVGSGVSAIRPFRGDGQPLNGRISYGVGKKPEGQAV